MTATPIWLLVLFGGGLVLLLLGIIAGVLIFAMRKRG
jgi:hypothetical protein